MKPEALDLEKREHCMRFMDAEHKQHEEPSETEALLAEKSNGCDQLKERAQPKRCETKICSLCHQLEDCGQFVGL